VFKFKNVAFMPTQWDQDESRRYDFHECKREIPGSNQESECGGHPDAGRRGHSSDVSATGENHAAGQKPDTLNDCRSDPRRIRTGSCPGKFFGERQTDDHEERRTFADRGNRVKTSRFRGPFTLPPDEDPANSYNTMPSRMSMFESACMRIHLYAVGR